MPNLSTENKLKLLNNIFEEISELQKQEDIFKYITKTLSSLIKNSIVLSISINEKGNITKLQSVDGLNDNIVEKIISKTGFNPVGNEYLLKKDVYSLFNKSKLIEFDGELMDFVSGQYPAFAVKQINRLININKIYTIGIRKDNLLFGAVHFFTLNNTEIKELDFIESIIKYISIVLKNKIDSIELEEKEKRLNNARKISKIGHFSYNLNKKQFSVSVEFYEIFGIKQKENIKLDDFLKTIISKDREEFKNEIIGNIKNKKTHFNNEFRIINLEDKQLKWVNVISSTIKNENDEIVEIYGTFQDVTDRKVIELALLESSSNLKAVMESYDESIWSVDKNYKIITYNTVFKESFYSQFGKKLIKGDKITNYIPDELKKIWINRYEKALNGESFVIIDKINMGGSTKYYRIHLHPIYNKNKTIGASVISEDITESKLHDIKLKQSEERFRKSFDTNPEAIAITKVEDGLYVNVNNGFCNTTGYTKNELIGKTSTGVNIWYYEEDREKMRKAIIDKGKVINKEFTFRHKNGSKIIGLLSATTLNFNNEPHILTITRDITKRKKAEEIQKILYNISSYSLSNTSVYSFFENIHKNIKKIINANNFYIALYNKNNNTYELPYHKDEFDKYEGIKNINLQGSFTDYTRQSKKAQIITDEKLKTIKDYDFKQIGNHSKVWIGAPLMNLSKNEVMGVIALQDYKDADKFDENDLNVLEIIAINTGAFLERINNLNELKKAKIKAEESDKLKTAFLTNMSHEIRTPMNGILGFLNLIKDESIPEIQKKEYFNIISKSGKRMLNTINDLIDISKIETNQVVINYSTFNIKEEFNEIYDFFKLEADTNKLDLILNINIPEDKLIIKTDRTKFNSIINNYLKNAIKYTKKGSVELKAEYKDNYYLFRVIDTGIGIPQNRLAAIFDRFIQADIEDRMAYEGSGLGLAISKSYAEMLDGELFAKSKISQGSEFIFKLPDKD